MTEGRKIRIPLREWRSKSWEEERERRLENLATENRDTKTIVAKLRVHSRVRVVSVTIGVTCSPSGRHSLLRCLGTMGTVINFDPRWTLPWLVKFDDGICIPFAEDNLEVLGP